MFPESYKTCQAANTGLTQKGVQRPMGDIRNVECGEGQPHSSPQYMTDCKVLLKQPERSYSAHLVHSNLNCPAIFFRADRLIGETDDCYYPGDCVLTDPPLNSSH